MKIIGITGGIGAGKSAVLSYLEKEYHCRVEQADLVAHKVKEPGQPCYEKLVQLLGASVLNGDGTIDKGRMAERIYKDPGLLSQVNAIIHPAVKAFFLEEIRKEREKQELDYFFLEAALLIEDGYEKIVDELWYIYADASVRKKRLMESRGYTEEKTEQIFKSQLCDADFRKHCDFVIDNSTSLSDTYEQIDRRLGDR